MEQLGKVISESPGRRFVISDIHGCIKSLKALWDSIDPQPADQVFFLGDYINKGPDSKGVIDFLLGLDRQGAEIHFLRGNHDQMLIDYYTLESGPYEPELVELNSGNLLKEKDSYLEFLKNTSHFFISGTYLLVHAGFNFNLANPFRDAESMLTIRGFSYDSKKAMNRSVIHGHYPKSISEIKSAIEERNKIIPLDNGCVYKDKDEQGALLCLELESWTLFSQPCLD